MPAQLPLPALTTIEGRFEIVEMVPDGVFFRQTRWALIDVREMRMISLFPSHAMADGHATALDTTV